MFLVFENAQVKPPAALEELQKCRWLTDMSPWLSTSPCSPQATATTPIKTIPEIELQGAEDNLSYPDTLAFVSGSDKRPNVDDAKPTAQQSTHPGLGQSPEMPKQKLNASAVSEENDGVEGVSEGVQEEKYPNSSSVDAKDNMQTHAGNNSVNQNGSKCDENRQITNIHRDRQVKSVHRKIFGNSKEDANGKSEK